jgi:metal-dependent hydrolase (beta-lactamase superfamily II)
MVTLAVEDRGLTIIYGCKRTGIQMVEKVKDFVRKKNKKMFQNLCGCLVKKTSKALRDKTHCRTG